MYVEWETLNAYRNVMGNAFRQRSIRRPMGGGMKLTWVELAQDPVRWPGWNFEIYFIHFKKTTDLQPKATESEALENRNTDRVTFHSTIYFLSLSLCLSLSHSVHVTLPLTPKVHTHTQKQGYWNTLLNLIFCSTAELHSNSPMQKIAFTCTFSSQETALHSCSSLHKSETSKRSSSERNRTQDKKQKH